MARLTILVSLLLASVSAAPAPMERSVALTFDDLPLVGALQDPADLEFVTARILGALAKHGAPASGFVTTRNVMHQGQVDLRLEALRRWIRAGHPLENHSYSHMDFWRTPLARYKDDAVQGDMIPRLLMAEAGKVPRYYRHPMNHTGATRQDKEAFESFMRARGYGIVPFTVEHADYAYNRLYEEAVRRGDQTEARQLGDAYLSHLDEALAFAERLSVETFGREIPQVFLVHSNRLNADYLDEMLRQFSARGYRFVTLDEALEDEALRTRDDYVGRSGISWIHRWRRTLGLEDRLHEEPDPPKWVLQSFRELLTGSR